MRPYRVDVLVLRDGQQRFQLIGQKCHLPTVLGTGVDECVEHRRWQARVKCLAAVGIDVDPVPLGTLRARSVALEHHAFDARMLQALRQAKATDAASNDKDF